MDCSAFRRHHLAYLDDTLPGDLLVSVERHRQECQTCAALDIGVRRALLCARNLPEVTPSADFAARLQARLREVDEGRCEVPVDWVPSWRDRSRFTPRVPSRRALAIAASLLAMASAGSAAWPEGGQEPVLLPPVVATLPEGEPAAGARLERMPASELVGAATAGIPVWPAALLAGESPVQFMSTAGGFELVSYQR
ncbi:hypothetical protein [Roseisolibacter sp. H3M3-2]|uniref:hypothetical protein n=1 Tax=Roseisolibacter sp. H3M3-2 TaxID=3031323 RepID=UPI0023DC0B62|nr:hypothetical protein [Roseisolibacter sp. H3M3-2]MDF1501756.1 hypothetical protein [Roseisolibacter sp. H3M3-2]